ARSQWRVPARVFASVAPTPARPDRAAAGDGALRRARGRGSRSAASRPPPGARIPPGRLDLVAHSPCLTSCHTREGPARWHGCCTAGSYDEVDMRTVKRVLL